MLLPIVVAKKFWGQDYSRAMLVILIHFGAAFSG